ncbi:MAG: hypothetical protein R3D71_00565 [Rickettsiales bacterium]
MEHNLEKIKIEQSRVDGKLISGILTGMADERNARNVALYNVAFYNKNIGRYEPVGSNYERINSDSIRQVSIDLGGGNIRYFRQIDYLDAHNKTLPKSSTGIRATAWEEIDEDGKAIKDEDGKQQIRIGFLGFSFFNNNDHRSLMATFDGRLNPQTVDAVSFTDNVISRIGKDNISSIIYIGHSMGSSNAMAASVMGRLHNIPTEEILLVEPVGASQQKEKIKSALMDKNSPFFREILKNMNGEDSLGKINNVIDTFKDYIARNTVSIRSVVMDDEGVLRPTTSASLPVGDGLWQVVSGQRNNPFSPEGLNNGMVGEKTYYQEIKGDCIVDKGLDSGHLLGSMVNCNLMGSDYYKPTDTPKRPGQIVAKWEK